MHLDSRGEPWLLRKLSWRWRIVYFAWTVLCWAPGIAFGIAQRTTNGGSTFDQTVEQLLFAAWFLGFIVLTAVWLMTRPKPDGTKVEDWEQR